MRKTSDHIEQTLLLHPQPFSNILWYRFRIQYNPIFWLISPKLAPSSERNYFRICIRIKIFLKISGDARFLGVLFLQLNTCFRFQMLGSFCFLKDFVSKSCLSWHLSRWDQYGNFPSCVSLLSCRHRFGFSVVKMKKHLICRV